MTGAVSNTHANDGYWYRYSGCWCGGNALVTWDGESTGWVYATTNSLIPGATYNVYLYGFANYSTGGGTGGMINYSLNNGGTVNSWWMPSSDTLTYMGQMVPSSSSYPFMFYSPGTGSSDRMVQYVRFDGVTGH